MGLEIDLDIFWRVGWSRLRGDRRVELPRLNENEKNVTSITLPHEDSINPYMSENAKKISKS